MRSERCTRSDRSRIASYLASLKQLVRGDNGGGAKFQNGCLAFLNVAEEVINAMEENSIPKSTTDAFMFGMTLLKRKI